MLRYSPRLLLLLVVTIIIGTVIYLDSSILHYSQHAPSLAGTTNNHPGPLPGDDNDDNNDDEPISPTNYKTNARILSPAHTALKIQWRTWSAQIYEQRPKVPQPELISNAMTLNGQARDAYRAPTHSRLHLSDKDVASLAKSHAALLASIRASAPPQVAETLYGGGGSGVVLVAGGEYFGPALISLRMLRRTGSTLPAEVFLGSSAEYEPEICEGVLPLLNARCLVIPDFFTSDLYVSSDSVGHYQLKALAMLFSSFRHMVFLDCDCIPLLDPAPLLAEAPYTSTGLVLWPDFWLATEDPVFWQIAGKGSEFPPKLPATSSEAGEVLLDKVKHLDTLLLAVYYNIYGPGWFYPLLSQGALGAGDKETFLAAAVATGKPYRRVRAPVWAVGYDRQDRIFKGSGMAQAHPGDDLKVNGECEGTGRKEGVRTMWLHVNTPKFNAGHLVDEGDLFDVDEKTRVRLLGPREEQVEKWGEDVERMIWKEVVKVGCELENVLKEWVGRKKVCERLKEHWKAVF